MSGASQPLAARLAGLRGPADREARERLLLAALADPSPQEREAAIALAAREIEPARLVPLVAESADAILRNAALAALERQGPYARAAMEQAVYSEDTDLAMFACQILARIGGESSVPALLHALSRGHANLTHAATEALGRLRRPEAVSPLLLLLAGEPWLQLAAVDALGAIGDPAAAAGILDLVPGTMVAEPALDALARIATPAALPRVLDLLGRPETRELWPALLRAAGAPLRRQDFVATGPAAEALVQFGRAVEVDRTVAGAWHFLAERLGGEGEDAPLGKTDDRSRARGSGASLQSAAALVLAAGITSLIPLVLRWGEQGASRTWLAPLVRRQTALLAPLTGSLLAHPDPGVRAGTLALLPARVSGAVLLVRALDDPATAVRIAACQALNDLPEPAALVSLTGLLDQGTPTERACAARALTRLPDSAYLPVLGSRLASATDEAVQLAILGALAEVHAPALEAEIFRLEAELRGVGRRAALRAVARIPGARSETVLLRALQDPDQGLQVEALDLLVGRGGGRVHEALLTRLGVGDSFRYHVIRALGRLGHAESAAPLIALYPEALLHERIEILTALGRLNGREAIPLLLAALKDAQPETRRVAALALTAHAGPGDLNLLEHLAADEDWVIRAEAAQALGRLGPAGRPLLLELGRDLELTVARTAWAAFAGQ